MEQELTNILNKTRCNLNIISFLFPNGFTDFHYALEFAFKVNWYNFPTNEVIKFILKCGGFSINEAFIEKCKKANYVSALKGYIERGANDFTGALQAVYDFHSKPINIIYVDFFVRQGATNFDDTFEHYFAENYEHWCPHLTYEVSKYLWYNRSISAYSYYTQLFDENDVLAISRNNQIIFKKRLLPFFQKRVLIQNLPFIEDINRKIVNFN